MKKKFISVIFAAAMVLSLCACSESVKIKSDEDRIHLPVGDEISLTAQTQKSETIKWSCEDTDVAVVTADGRLTGVSNGVTVITAKTDSGYDTIGLVVGNGVKGTEVQIYTTDENGNPVASGRPAFNKDSKITDLQITLNGMTEDETLLLNTDKEAYLKVRVTPSDCNDALVYESSDSNVLEVDSDGVVYPKSKGTVTVTATAPNGVSDTFKIFVR